MSENATEERELGTGGGYGKNAALSVKEFRALMAKCKADPSMRSVKVILRIAKEQLEARGSLGSYPIIAGIFFVVAIAAFPLQNSVPQAKFVSAAALLVGAGMMASSWSVRHQRRAAMFQEKLIQRESLEALIEIVESPSFVAGTLDWSQALTLQRLMSAEKSTNGPLKGLLEAAER